MQLLTRNKKTESQMGAEDVVAKNKQIRNVWPPLQGVAKHG